jgi:hypothetical protein
MVLNQAEWGTMGALGFRKFSERKGFLRRWADTYRLESEGQLCGGNLPKDRWNQPWSPSAAFKDCTWIMARHLAAQSMEQKVVWPRRPLSMYWSWDFELRSYL